MVGLKNQLQAVGEALDREHGPHLYRQIASLIRDRVLSGQLAPGESLPAQRELAVAWGVGEVTVRRALQQLAGEGLLDARAGSGTVIRTPEHHDPAAQPAPTTLTLGVAFTDLNHGYPFFRPVLDGLRDGRADTAVRLFDMPEDEQTRGSLDHAPSLVGLHGLIMMSPVNLALLALAQQRRLPTVLLFNDLADGFSTCIAPDYAGGVADAVNHLTAAGRTRIALVTAGPERFSTGRWREAFGAAMRGHGLSTDPSMMVFAGYTEREGAQATRTLLARDPKPEAIIFASDFMARGGLLAAHEAGLAVPDDLALIGAGPVLEDGGWTVPLTTIDLGLFAMGRHAREAIEAARAGQASPQTRCTTPAALRPGGTA